MSAYDDVTRGYEATAAEVLAEAIKARREFGELPNPLASVPMLLRAAELVGIDAGYHPELAEEDGVQLAAAAIRFVADLRAQRASQTGAGSVVPSSPVGAGPAPQHDTPEWDL